MTTVYNFSAGPAVMPKEVLAQAQRELLDWRESGMSVMEMSHRGLEFSQIIGEAEEDLRELMAISANYEVLFMQGGATSQFAMVPMNLIGRSGTADYVNTGHWSKGAIKEAKRYGKVNIVASSEDKQFSYVPEQALWQCNPAAAYLHYTPNETIGGVEFNRVPESGDVPLVADMSSSILSRPVEVSKFGIIYGGAQKNIGPSGLVVVIIRKDLIGSALPFTPTMFDYRVHAANGSMYNTPATFAVYVAGLIFKWLRARGGLAAMEQVNIRKAALLYGSIEQSNGFYYSPVEASVRSRMNVPFRLRDESLNDAFLNMATGQNLLQLKGHKSVGGMRASIYNAMPIEGVEALVAMMRQFAHQYG